jgi:hypothetical protein
MCLVSIGGNIPTHTRKPKLVIPSGQTSSIQRDLNINIRAPLSLSLKSLQALLCSDPSTFL